MHWTVWLSRPLKTSPPLPLPLAAPPHPPITPPPRPPSLSLTPSHPRCHVWLQASNRADSSAAGALRGFCHRARTHTRTKVNRRHLIRPSDVLFSTVRYDGAMMVLRSTDRLVCLHLIQGLSGSHRCCASVRVLVCVLANPTSKFGCRSWMDAALTVKKTEVPFIGFYPVKNHHLKSRISK